jgi:hypothetical protein
MNYIAAPLKGLLVGILSLTAPIWVLLALPFIKWDKTQSTLYGIPTFRGDLPNWLYWLSTPDERLPGGLYEPAHKEVFDKWGKWVASWYWLGVRNRMMGLGHSLGIQATEYIPDQRGFYRNGDVWQYSVHIVFIRIALGYKVYKMADGFWAVPTCAIMGRSS